MIYTMTLNPALDYNVITESFQEKRVNRSKTEYFVAGGKGLMESQMLHNLGVESIALGLVAGFTGEQLTKMLEAAGIRTEFVVLPEGMTRINVKLWGGIEGEINAAGPGCDENSRKVLCARLSELGQKDILCLAGTIPAGMPKNLYAEMMKICAKQGCRVVVDATGETLKETLSLHPFLVKPNHHELGELYQKELTTKEEVAFYAKKLCEDGVRNCLVSMGGDGAVLVAEDGVVYFGEAPEGIVKNTVGSGDSMVAGFLAAYEKTHSYETAFRMGIASGSASAFSDSLGTSEEVQELLSKVRITKAQR